MQIFNIFKQIAIRTMLSLTKVGHLAYMSRTAEIFGANLRERRKALNLSQSDLALAVGVSGPTVSQWETGKYLPDGDAMDRVLAAVKATPEQMFSSSGKKFEPLISIVKPISLAEALQTITDNWDQVELRRKKPKG